LKGVYELQIPGQWHVEGDLFSLWEVVGGLRLLRRNKHYTELIR
jgi:hypothetical protein